MPNCEKIEKCPFFNNKMANMPAIADIMKKKYCQGDKSQCARYHVASSGKQVPPDLFPNMLDQAEKIIAS